MSVASMVARMGVQVGVRTPTVTVDAYGVPKKTYSAVTHIAFVQERSSSDGDAQGRANLRNASVIYFEGSPSITIDDVVSVPPTGNKCELFRVTGVRVPDRASWHPNAHTIVDAVRVGPTEIVA